MCPTPLLPPGKSKVVVFKEAEVEIEALPVEIGSKKK